MRMGGFLQRAGSLDYITNGIKTLKEKEKEKKENKNLEIIALTYPEIITNSSKEGARRTPLTGTVDEFSDQGQASES